MDEQLRKRLEEAADIYAKRIWKDLLEIHISKTDFIAGAEHGYKEAIEVAKEWLKEHWGDYYAPVEWRNLTADFEADMNKLWEEKK